MIAEAKYFPKSDFLNLIISEDIRFDGEHYGEENLKRLIALTTDDDVSNRDWAVILLSHTGIDRQDIRDALIAATDDPVASVRSEAIYALIEFDRELALRLTQRELKSDHVNSVIFDAALELADQSLIEDLECFQDESDSSFVDNLAADALKACKGVNKKQGDK